MPARRPRQRVPRGSPRPMPGSAPSRLRPGVLRVPPDLLLRPGVLRVPPDLLLRLGVLRVPPDLLLRLGVLRVPPDLLLRPGVLRVLAGLLLRLGVLRVLAGLLLRLGVLRVLAGRSLRRGARHARQNPPRPVPSAPTGGRRARRPTETRSVPLRSGAAGRRWTPARWSWSRRSSGTTRSSIRCTTPTTATGSATARSGEGLSAWWCWVWSSCWPPCGCGAASTAGWTPRSRPRACTATPSSSPSRRGHPSTRSPASSRARASSPTPPSSATGCAATAS